MIANHPKYLSSAADQGSKPTNDLSNLTAPGALEHSGFRINFNGLLVRAAT